MMKKLKIKKCVNSCISRLKKKYPLFLIIVISLVMWWIGWISRGFKFIRWDTVNYGSVAEWFSGIGTIIAIFSSFYFFKEENEPRISIVNAYLGGNKIFITAINSGRAPIYIKFGRFQFPGSKEIHSSEKIMKDPFVKLNPGENYEVLSYTADEILSLLDDTLKVKTTYFKAVYSANNYKLFSKEFTITNGRFGGHINKKAKWG